MKQRTVARQLVIDRAREWREKRDACRMRWQVIAEVAGIDEPRFESILGAKAVPT